MNRQRINENIFISILISILYTIYFYIGMKLIIDHNMLISINNVTINNVGIKFIGDFFIMLLLPLVLIVIYRKRLITFKLHFIHTGLQYLLIVIMIVLFLQQRNFTINGYYKLFFYLFVVSFGEEFIFRGYVYNKLIIHSKLLAIIVSGFFWGILHAILPGLLTGNGLGQIGIAMLSEIGGGIIMGYYFIYLLEKSNTLFIPIFVHAILDYNVGGIGIPVLTAIGTGAYLYIVDRKKSTKPL